MTEFHTILTEQEIQELEALLAGKAVGSMAVERPVTPVVDGYTLEGSVPLGAQPRLSRSTQEAMRKKQLAAEKRKAYRESKRKTAPKGRRSYKSKEATKRRRKNNNWIRNPLKCLTYGHGVWAISQADWDRRVADLWVRYNPLKLTVKRKWGYGTREKPYTIHDIDVYYKGKLVYKGEDYRLIDYSEPNELDKEKAPEGAVLFDASSKYWLSMDSFVNARLAAAYRQEIERLSHALAALQPKGAEK